MASYEENKTLYGAARARQMEQQAASQPVAAPAAQATQPGAYSTPQDLANFQTWYGQQQGGNRPEDMARFLWTGNQEGVGNMSGDRLSRWNPYLISSGPGAGKYRSMRGAQGLFDKPTECPPGTYPSGPNETDPCTGGGQAAASQTQTPMGTGQTGMSLQDFMAQIQAGMGQLQQPVQQQPVSSPTPLNAATAPAIQTSSIQGLMSGLQGHPAASGTSTGGLTNTGWSSTSGGLQNILTPYMKKQSQTSWF